MESQQLRSFVSYLMISPAVVPLTYSVALAQNEEVVVTGTSIRGTAPIGSNIISVDRVAIETTGATNIQELMTNIPQIGGASTSFGGSGQRMEAGGGGFTSPNIHSLGTQASTATLVLVDGHIIPPVGSGTLVVDPAVIPTAALQRVEVLPDGASAIYGANAVAGVINYITRRDYSGWETRVGANSADHYNAFNFSQVFGHTWDGGSVMAVYAYNNRGALASKWRKFMSQRQDIRMGAMTAEQRAMFSGLPANPPAGIPTTLVGPSVAVSGSDALRGMAVPYPSIGSNFQNFNCPVAAISATQTGNAFLYPYTSGTGSINNVTVTNGSGGTMTESGFRRSVANGGTQGVCDQEDYRVDLFSDAQQNGLVAIRQAITDRISVSVDLVRGAHLTTTRNARGSTSGFAFNPAGTGGPSFGTNQRNPFYVGVPGAAANATSQFVTFGFDELLKSVAPGAYSKQDITNQFAALGLDVDLGADWAMTFGSTLGQSLSGNRNGNGISAAEVFLALNGTTNSTGAANTTIATTALSDPYGLGTIVNVTRALTTANALDVWNPPATNRTSAAVLRSLTDASTRNATYSNVQDVIVKFDGPIGDFWGAGPMKAAFGGNYNHYTQMQYRAGNNNIGPSSTSSRGTQFAFNRTSYAAFVEFLIPLIGADMEIPGVQKFVINMSGRYDHFSDFGTTLNPKASFSWAIIDGLAGRGSYSTSFVAPNPHDVGGPQGINSQTTVSSTQITNGRIIPFLAVNPLPFSQGPFGSAYGAGTAGTIVENQVACNALNSVAGLSTGTATIVDVNGNIVPVGTALGTGSGQAYGCRLTTSGNSGFGGLNFDGANPNLKPERGLTYSAGIDIDGGQLWDVLEGFTASVSYYNTKFIDIITSSGVQANIPEATSFAPVCGSGSTSSTPGTAGCLPGWAVSDALIQDLIAVRPIGGPLPVRIYTITGTGIQNPYTVWQAGLDFELNYRVQTDSWGTFTWSLNGNQILRFSQKANSAISSVVDVNNCTNNARYCTPELQGSMRVGWRYEDLSTNFTFNYTHPYWVPSNNFPWTLAGPDGRRAGFEHLGSLQTFDLSVSYTLPSEWWSGTSVVLNVRNLLDKPPPFFDSATGFEAGSEIGRLVGMTVTKKW